MQLYNTLSRRLQEFTPQNPPEVTLYTCGPTVYDYLQIGNWIAYVRWDTLVRTLKENSYAVEWVMNITDVGHLTSDADEGEDKLEKGARREGKTAWDVAKFYTQDFEQGMKLLNILTPDHLVPATDTIAEQIGLIKVLEQKGYTYVIDDGVYFDSSKFPSYGALARLDVKGLQAGARVAFNSQKHGPTDFALWKFTPPGQKRDMEWDSPWGKGFPGWHLECSAIAMKYLGNTIDIHAGGIDHIPVHHTNEIAQSEAATGTQFVHYWLHGAFLNVDGAKLAKSAGNSHTLQDVLAQGFDPLDLRLLFLQSHYRTSSNFTWGGLEAAQQRRLKLQAFADLRFQLREGGELDTPAFIETQRVMLESLNEDLNTPEALAALSDIVEAGETKLIDATAKDDFVDFLAFLDRVLGLKLLESSDITAEQKELLAQRDAARASHDFSKADAARDTLTQSGIELRDTPLGTIWSRV